MGAEDCEDRGATRRTRFPRTKAICGQQRILPHLPAVFRDASEKATTEPYSQQPLNLSNKKQERTIMPATLTYPGVCIEEIPSGVRTITGIATSTLEPDTECEIARIWNKRLPKTTLVMPALFPDVSAGATQAILTMPLRKH
jgi:hypothetical protein